MKFQNEQNIFYCKQYGFRKGFSTAHAIISVIDNIESIIVINNLLVEFLLTYKKYLIQLITTFYLKKVQHYGIRGIAHHWFKPCLDNRKTVCIRQCYGI